MIFFSQNWLNWLALCLALAAVAAASSSEEEDLAAEGSQQVAVVADRNLETAATGEI